MTNLVTGSRGFIGSCLMKKLNGAGAIYHNEIVHGHAYNADRLFFLSTYGNMAHHVGRRKMIKANVEDLLTVLNGFSGWVCYMSSSSVLLPVQTPYSRTKRAAEEILQVSPSESCIVRPYSVTGVGEQEEHLIPTLIRSCMEGEEMPFDPWPVHDFIDVEGVVDGLIRLADDQSTGIYEFGHGIPVTNQKVKEIVENVCGKKANIKVTRNIRPYDSTAWYCMKPQFRPAKSLRKSIEEMVEAYRAK